MTMQVRFESSQRRGGISGVIISGLGHRGQTGEKTEFSLTAGKPRVGSRKRMIAASRFGSGCLMFRVPGRGKDFSVRWDHI